MEQSYRKGYLRLIDEILHLLVREYRLRRALEGAVIQHDGLVLGRDDRAVRRELAEVEAALESISRTHGRLVELLRERIRMRDYLQRPVRGNAGHFRRFQLRCLLEDNKRRIRRLLRESA